MKKRNGRNKGVKRSPTVRKKIFISLTVLSVSVLAIILICQSFLLSPLHRAVKTGEMKRCAAGIAEADPSSYDEICEDMGTRYNLCISVFDMENGAKQVASWHSTLNPFCFIHGFVSDSMIYELTERMGNKGEYLEAVAIAPMIGDGGRTGDEGESLLYAKAYGGRLVVLNAHISPLSTTVTTLWIMTACISVALIVAAAILSYFLSKRLSGPIVRMRDGARKLAAGEYGVRFDGGGSRETEELADTLNMAARELEQTDRIRRDLIANVSHDLRTPLTLISGYAEVMRDIPGEMTAENMGIIIEETKMLSSLVNDMLDASKLGDGAIKLNPEPFDLTEALRQTAERYSKLMSPDGYEIRFESDGGATVTADKTRILQVVYNLMNNAVNYTGEDKVVVLRQTVSDGVCRVEVTDTGDGISEEELPFIWDRYYKSKEFHKRTAQGTGLGLSIVKNLLMLQGAKFGVNSEKGKGSTFWFELPTED